MDLAGNRKDDGTPIVMYTGNDTTAQVWSIYQLDGGRDKLNYSISTDKSIADAGKTVNITVGGSIPYVYNYRFHVVSSDGKDTVINNGCNAQVWSIYQLDAARDKLNYTITASNANPAINAKVNINISGSLPYVYNYKIHIVDPTGKEAVVDNLCNPTYSFSRATPGKYIIYVEVTSPLYKETGSKTNKAVTVNVACTHNWGVWTTTKNATCTSDGQKTRKCSICGKTETQTISKTGHHYQETVVNPTYSEQGYTLHKCTGCGSSYKDKYVAKKRWYDPAKKPVASEVKKLQQILTKTTKLAANEDLVDMFDANGDGKVNVFDVLILKRRALK